jgi:hypothetical protein
MIAYHFPGAELSRRVLVLTSENLRNLWIFHLQHLG